MKLLQLEYAKKPEGCEIKYQMIKIMVVNKVVVNDLFDAVRGFVDSWMNIHMDIGDSWVDFMTEK